MSFDGRNRRWEFGDHSIETEMQELLEEIERVSLNPEFPAKYCDEYWVP
jgi:hypothetical protein